MRGELQWRWYRLDKAGFDALEADIVELRVKMLTAVGWNAGHACRTTTRSGSSAVYPAVRFKGPGRAPRRGRRGRQTEFTPAPEPDTGLYPVYPIPDGPFIEPELHDDDAPRLEA